MTPEASFLSIDGSDRFCLLHRPPGALRGGLVYLHPFAEEMNRSRAAVAHAARAFAANGYAVLQIDLFGCGDSAGDFGEASWSQWKVDAQTAVRLLQERMQVPTGLWGLRAGALLAAEVSRELDTPVPLLLWQPVLSGRQHLQQFLRLHLAAEMLEGRAQEGRVQGGTDACLAQLNAGLSIEIAGYMLSPALAHGLAGSELCQPAAERGMYCLEAWPGGTEVSPALRRFIEAGTASGGVCDDAQCWLSQDIKSCPELTRTSLAVLPELLQ